MKKKIIPGMTEKYDQVFESNRQWIEQNREHNPGLFKLLAEEQRPIFYISAVLTAGCIPTRLWG